MPPAPSAALTCPCKVHAESVSKHGIAYRWRDDTPSRKNGGAPRQAGTARTGDPAQPPSKRWRGQTRSGSDVSPDRRTTIASCRVEKPSGLNRVAGNRLCLCSMFAKRPEAEVHEPLTLTLSLSVGGPARRYSLLSLTIWFSFHTLETKRKSARWCISTHACILQHPGPAPWPTSGSGAGAPRSKHGASESERAGVQQGGRVQERTGSTAGPRADRDRLGITAERKSKKGTRDSVGRR
ncbi:hypothetical protein MAPG_08569 [Magnaporthiopsis poae ATCC 64411]|uniref:Uncharacterized protein n=1 Tax=Magnaporthiopsis poae (strain ATCC 64411 / 73-15) TaxID=644358 RepID=A0A0C4E7Q0_MAGP6|nr:hypothetical protein MAPG_08569 [Magnaporthiopsis poae ATCC 64411]